MKNGIHKYEGCDPEIRKDLEAGYYPLVEVISKHVSFVGYCIDYFSVYKNSRYKVMQIDNGTEDYWNNVKKVDMPECFKEIHVKADAFDVIKKIHEITEICLAVLK